MSASYLSTVRSLMLYIEDRRKLKFLTNLQYTEIDLCKLLLKNIDNELAIAMSTSSV